MPSRRLGRPCLPPCYLGERPSGSGSGLTPEMDERVLQAVMGDVIGSALRLKASMSQWAPLGPGGRWVQGGKAQDLAATRQGAEQLAVSLQKQQELLDKCKSPEASLCEQVLAAEGGAAAQSKPEGGDQPLGASAPLVYISVDAQGAGRNPWVSRLQGLALGDPDVDGLTSNESSVCEGWTRVPAPGPAPSPQQQRLELAPQAGEQVPTGGSAGPRGARRGPSREQWFSKHPS